MYSRSVLELFNQSYHIPKIAGALKNFDMLNKSQRKMLSLKIKTYKNPNTNLEYVLINLDFGEMQKKEKWPVNKTDPRCLEPLQIKPISQRGTKAKQNIILIFF